MRNFILITSPIWVIILITLGLREISSSRYDEQWYKVTKKFLDRGIAEMIKIPQEDINFGLSIAFGILVIGLAIIFLAWVGKEVLK